MAVIAVLGTLDSKHAETAYLARVIEDAGHEALLIDCSVAAGPRIVRENADLPSTARGPVPKRDAPVAVALERTGEALGEFLRALYRDRRFDGAIGLGGGKGTNIVGIGMRSLPLRVPKVIVSCARPDMFGAIVGHYGIVIVPSGLDLVGLNTFTRAVIAAGARVIAAMLDDPPPFPSTPRPRTAAITAFGVTSAAASGIKKALEAAGWEVWLFPATGAGGRTMETLVSEGEVGGVVDLTTAELANHLIGGLASAGAQRLDAAGARGIPHVVLPGGMDFVNFAEPASVPRRFRRRRSYRHTPHTTVVRTSRAENYALGRLVGEKLRRSRGAVAVLVPRRGFSAYDAEGGPLWDPRADKAWLDGLRTTLPPSVPVLELDHHINDPEVASTAADVFLSLAQQAPVPVTEVV